MKIVSPGTLVYAGGFVNIVGWTFDVQGEWFSDHNAFKCSALHATLAYIAETNGVKLGDPPEPVERADLAVERLTLDALATMRWGPSER